MADLAPRVAAYATRDGLRGEGFFAFHRRRRRLLQVCRRKLGPGVRFESPRTFSEKIQFRKLYGQHATYAYLADKFAARDFVAARAGADVLVPLHTVCDRITPEMLASLPDRVIAKATHGCKWNHMIRDKAQTDLKAVAADLNAWVGRVYGEKTREFHYRLVRPRILVEQILEDRQGRLPGTYYFFCFHSPGRFDWSYAVSPPGVSKVAHFDSDGRVWDSDLTEAQMAQVERPASFPDLVEVARKLSAGFDFCRVDLYHVDGRTYFGEMSPTPHAGMGETRNPEFNAFRSQAWQLDGGNRLLYRRRPR